VCVLLSARCLLVMDYSEIVKCMNFAAVKHCNQRRKDSQETPYINHPVGKCRAPLTLAPLSVSGLFVPRTIRTLDYSYHGWTIRTLDDSYDGLFVLWTIRTMDFSYHGLFVLWTVRTIHTV